MSETLDAKKCIPCSGGTPPLESDQKKNYLKQLKDGWRLCAGMTKIEKQFKFKNFKKTMSFINEVADIAEREWHHPDITFGWGYAHIQIQTHKINNLVESDFILAAKIDQISH